MNKLQKYLDSSAPKKFRLTMILEWSYNESLNEWFSNGEGTSYTIFKDQNTGLFVGSIYLINIKREFSFNRDTLEDAQKRCQENENTYDCNVRGKTSV